MGTLGCRSFWSFNGGVFHHGYGLDQGIPDLPWALSLPHMTGDPETCLTLWPMPCVHPWLYFVEIASKLDVMLGAGCWGRGAFKRVKPEVPTGKSTPLLMMSLLVNYKRRVVFPTMLCTFGQYLVVREWKC